MQKQDILLGAGVVVSFAAGFGLGYYVVGKKLMTKYDQMLEAEIEETKKFFSVINRSEGYATPEEAAETLGVPAPVAETLRRYDYTKTTVKPEDLEDPGSLTKHVYEAAREAAVNEALTISAPIEEVRNVFADSAEMEEAAIASMRDPEKPYIITPEEFAVNDPDYDQLSITYFEGDGVLTDDTNQHIPDDDRCVGLGNLEKFDEQEDIHTLYVRNERMKTDFEVTRSTGKFSEEVLGFEHSDDTYMRSRRKQRLSDD